jgi:hypothetical protein
VILHYRQKLYRAPSGIGHRRLTLVILDTAITITVVVRASAQNAATSG